MASTVRLDPVHREGLRAVEAVEVERALDRRADGGVARTDAGRSGHVLVGFGRQGDAVGW
ncbi:hypothetical protein BRD17_00230 [Halobacteriales archaeon SW_7_68_16]|nr:MAG: hypothetical protein BRD17_00230 [Halobacteriales archaeon SW_7_68_16]